MDELKENKEKKEQYKKEMRGMRERYLHSSLLSFGEIKFLIKSSKNATVDSSGFFFIISGNKIRSE